MCSSGSNLCSPNGTFVFGSWILGSGREGERRGNGGGKETGKGKGRKREGRKAEGTKEMRWENKNKEKER